LGDNRPVALSCTYCSNSGGSVSCPLISPLSPSGIYFVPAEAPKSLRYFDFATRQIRPIFEADKDIAGGLSVSPDGHWILYSQAGDTTGDIMLVDHFH
jgi:hypothetical protein